MKVHQLSSLPAPALARALAEFEQPFTYPLGPGKMFRISHGEDYSLFFRSQGEASCFILEHEGRILGSLGTVVRKLLMPDGTERSTAYFGDLKIAPDARGGTVLIRLARAADAWVRPRVQAAFGVVMGGTSLTPDAYTGRVGIPGFQELGRLVILRISSREEGSDLEPGRFLTTSETALACYRHLSLGRYACPVGDATLRSQIAPVWLMQPDGSACGLLEDTRKAKRLIAGDGSELLSADLSSLAYNSISAATGVVRIALRAAARSGLPALFVAVAEGDAGEIRAGLKDAEVLAAPAAVYGAGLPPGAWNINSSEI